MATERQVRANQQNARKSTGPTSIVGKRKVSGNRITHGILSNKLLLAGGAQEDYQALWTITGGVDQVKSLKKLGIRMTARCAQDR